MAVSSTMLDLGTQAPEFRVTDVVTGKTLTLSDFSSDKLFLVIFLCRHCPYVKHVEGELARIGAEYRPKGVGIIGISSNDADKYPDDAPASLKEWAGILKFNFPIAHDASQEAAKAYRAACTPEFYLFNAQRKLIYRGQLDDSRPKNTEPITGKDLRQALEAGLKGQPLSPDQKPGIGCNIKWKPGREPDYFAL